MEGFDALYVRQREIYANIEKIGTNFCKDSASRKTEEYIQKRLEALKNLWSEFEENHAKLLTSDFKTHEYFVKNSYEVVKQRYEYTHRLLSSFNPSTNFEDKAVSSKTDDLKSQQRTNFRAFLRVVRGIDIDSIVEKWELEDKLNMIQQRWRIIDELHWQIDNVLTGSDTFYEMEYSEHENTYEKTKRMLNMKLNASLHQQQSTPRIELPTFSGNYTQWPTFMDLYTEAIHNNPILTKTQKMQHLKGKLKGEPERLVQHLHVTADNYDTCWEILTHRYNNIQILFTKQIQLFMNQPAVHRQTAFDLRRLHDISLETIHAIQNLGIDTTTWDPILVHIISEKFDSDTYTAYMETRRAPRELPSFDELMSFLESKFIALEPLHKRNKNNTLSINPQPINHSEFSKKYLPNNLKSKFVVGKSYHTQTDRICPLCKTSDHILFSCKSFQSMSSDAKMNTITQLQICQNCLYCHNGKQCNSSKRCKLCNQHHNTILHNVIKESTKEINPTPKVTPTSIATRKANHVSSDVDEVLLATVQLKIRAEDGTYIQMRALLDQGSQINLITENATQRLGLPRRRQTATVSGVGTSCNQSKGLVQLTCQSLHDDYTFTTEALVMTKMLNNLPNHTFNKQTWEHICNLHLADPDYNISRPVDLLLDASVYAKIVMDGMLRGPVNAPIAQQTKLGWVLVGGMKSFNCFAIMNNIEEVSQFWEIEEIPNNQRELTVEEEYCETLYQNTTTRNTEGRYQVRIPMKKNFEEKLGQSKPQAIAQFRHLEKRLASDTIFSQDYKNFMQEYIQLNHMKKCLSNIEPNCFLPHHGVIKLDSTTTKLRVVFNASSRTQTGFSLNDLMECGQNLQKDLLSLILRWRKYRYVYTADIEKFYRQIQIQEADQHLQKIIWRDSCSEMMTEYQLCTVTYGTKAAPFLALRTIKQLIHDDGEHYPQAADILNNQLFVDDLLGGSNSIDEAKNTQQQLIDMLQGGGFNLRKWTSNSPRLLEGLSPQQINQNMFDFKHAQTNKTLGISWNPTTDQFTFQQIILNNGIDDVTTTKRSLLSDMSKLYDPLGWLSPVTVKAKIMFQQVWSSGIDWDEQLPENLQQEWNQFRRDLSNVHTITVHRSIGNTDLPIEFHGFCDASERAYACVIYCKSTNEESQQTIKLVAAKTKLTPLHKTISLPRLELCGAVLLSKLMKKVIDSMPEQTVAIHGWTDSMVTLGWLQGEPSRWKTFVSNRVKEITQVMPVNCWRHTKSADNPADCASRGLLPTQLISHPLWWEGPTWLSHTTKKVDVIYDLPTEERKSIQTNVAIISSSIVDTLLQKCNSMTRAVRTIAWVSRFIANARCKYENDKRKGHLTTSELKESHNIIIKSVQSTCFADDIKQLQEQKMVHQKSKIICLHPFLDKQGILRVGGRLSQSYLPFTQKHPIILAKNNRLTQLLIEQAHKTTLHGGARLTLSFLRNKYWILGGNNTVKKHIRQCVRCHRFKITNNYQLMSDLPQPRVTPSRPFTFTGVDFTGQVEVKANKGRGVTTTKGYIAVFVCLSTKAIHLELVSDLSTKTFIAALKRFCSRRGAPTCIYSDNGTNFVGAAKYLAREHKEALKYYINRELLDHVSETGIQWQFNAPAWPSAGGLWEAAVKGVKFHLKRVLHEQKLTYEEFSTLLTQVEACLNSRPLMPLTENTEDLEYLTPGHFLVGGPVLSPPLSVDDNISSLRCRWQLTEKLHKDFWKKWSMEYLQTLQSRGKWQTAKPNIAVGDMVLVKEDNVPPAKWLLARVTELHPGKDDVVRVVTLRTKNGTLKRPIIKISPLPIQSEQINTDSEQHKNSQQRQRRNKSLIGSKLNYMYTILLFFILLITPTIQHTYNVTSLDATKPVYFDKISDVQIIQDNWKIIVYYNMTNYWQSIIDINKYVYHLNSLCKNDTACLSIAAQLQHEINELQHNNQLLISQHTARRKRGLINGIGYAANSLFGLLDERFVKRYENDINLLQNNQNHLLKLYKQQTTIVEGEYNLLNRNENVMNTQFALINKHLAEVQKEERQIERNYDKSMYLISGTLAASLIISNLHRIQYSLLGMITDLRNGQADLHLLRPDQFIEQLNTISGQLPSDLTLPTFNNKHSIKDLYKLIKVHSSLTKNYMIFEVKLPLINNDKYELYKIITIPQQRGNKTLTIIPTTAYIAINLRKDMFLPIQESQLQACVHYDESNTLCPLTQPIYNLKGTDSMCEAQIINNQNITQCKTQITPCSDKWIQLHNAGAWFFSCCQECTVRIFCSAGVTSKTLHGTGLLSLGQGCLLKGDTFTIHSHYLYHSFLKLEENEIKILQSPEINNFISNSTNRLFVRENHDELLNDLRQRIDSVKDQQDTVQNYDLSTHDIHQYTVLYVIVSIALISLMTWGIIKIKERYSRKYMVRETSTIEQQRGDSDRQTQRSSRVNGSDSAVQTVKYGQSVNLSEIRTPMFNIASDTVHSDRIDEATSPTMSRMC